MESLGSCSVSTAPTFLASKSVSLGMAIGDGDNRLGHESSTWSRVPSSASSKTEQAILVEGAFKCKLCPRAFKTARARGGHQKAHRQLRAPVKKQKARKGGRPCWSPASSYATVLRSACLHAQPFVDWRSHYDPSVYSVPPSFPWQTGTGAVAPAHLSTLVAGYRGTRDGGNLGHQHGAREEIQDETPNGLDLALKL